MAGVSTATVSRVLARSGRVSADLEARVHSAAKELNYQPNRAARALRVRQGSTVGVLIPDIQNLFFTAIIRGIDDEIQRHGYTTLLANPTTRSNANASTSTRSAPRVSPGCSYPVAVRRSDLPPVPRNRRAARGARPHGAPAQRRPGLGHQPRARRTPVRHLAELGHRRIAMMAGLEAHNVGAERRRGFLAGMEAAGIPSTTRSSATAASSARRADGDARAAQSADPPTAIFAPTHDVARRHPGDPRAQAARAEDVSVVGFDDMPWQVATQPPLTASRNRATTSARRQRGCSSPASPTDEPSAASSSDTLIVRGSSGPPPVR
jgi:DNA-binding LacI/PurR family transcriptional regulator